MQWRQPSTDIVYDARLLEKVKESFCHLDIDQCGSVEGEVVHSPPGQTRQSYSISVQDDAMKCVLGLFAPEVLSLTGHKGSHLYAPQAADPQDPHDDFYILQTQRRRGDAEFEDGEDEDGTPVDLKDPIRQETIPVAQVGLPSPSFCCLAHYPPFLLCYSFFPPHCSLVFLICRIHRTGNKTRNQQRQKQHETHHKKANST